MARISEIQNGNLQIRFDSGTQIEIKRPNRIHLGQILAASRKDPLSGADILIKQCLVSGDRSIADDAGHAHQLVALMNDIFDQQSCLLNWDANVATIEYADEKVIQLRKLSRQEYSSAMAASRINPLRLIEDIMRMAWVDGEESVKTSVGHLLGFTEVIDDYLKYTGDALGN